MNVLSGAPECSDDSVKCLRVDVANECGIKIIGTFETFSPTFPTPEIASILRISPRDPILKIQTQAVDSNSIPLDYSLLYSNIFEFQVKYFFPR